MHDRLDPALGVTSPRSPLVAPVLRRVFRAGLGARQLRTELLAGVTVGIIALPLSMALAIASGVPPQYGLYTAIVAGAVVPLLGGAWTSVTGPTAAFVVILAPVSAKYGLGGLLLATLMAGVIQIAMGVGRLGQLIQFIPYPVTTGFTAGIAVVIATLQVKDFLGLTMAYQPEHYIERVAALAEALPTVSWADLSIGALTLALLLVWRRVNRSVPPQLVAPAVAAFAAWGLSRWAPGFDVATIASRFSYEVGGVAHTGVPALPPHPLLPWTMPGANGEAAGLSFALLRDLLGPATAIALLGAIESLLTAVVADGIGGTRHNPDAELVAQGVGNVVAPFFGGFAATGAIARSAAGIRAGGRTPLFPFFHAVFILAAMLSIGPLLGFLPMASLAALLLLVAWNMSDLKHFAHILRVAPRSDIVVLLTCFGLTVVFDMVVAVGVGFILAALLFMRRMAEIAHVRLFAEQSPHPWLSIPEDTIVYEINGPLFFGAAEKAVSALRSLPGGPRRVILNVAAVPVIDVTGLVALESALQELRADGTQVILAGLQPQPARALQRAGFGEVPGVLRFAPDLEAAIVAASTE